MMCAHGDVVATVVLLLVHMPVPSSGPSSGARCAIHGLQVGRVVLPRIALHSPMQLAELHRTMEPDSGKDDPPDLQTMNGAARAGARPA